MVKMFIVFVGAWLGVLCLVCTARQSTLKDWKAFLKVAGLSLLTTSITAAILATLVSLF